MGRVARKNRRQHTPRHGTANRYGRGTGWIAIQWVWSCAINNDSHRRRQYRCRCWRRTKTEYGSTCTRRRPSTVVKSMPADGRLRGKYYRILSTAYRGNRRSVRHRCHEMNDWILGGNPFLGVDAVLVRIDNRFWTIFEVWYFAR